jgi:hypothetical protein
MRYPPALRWPLQSAWSYRGFSLLISGLITTILIANYVDFVPGSEPFFYKKAVLSVLGLLVMAWLLWDAWHAREGELVYAQGQWLLRQHGQEIPGTLRLHLDLQNYMLASFEQNQLQPANKKWKRALQWMFKPSLRLHSATFSATNMWVHLEPWQSGATSGARPAWPSLPVLPPLSASALADWPSLRRAIYAPQPASLKGAYEELAV